MMASSGKQTLAEIIAAGADLPATKFDSYARGGDRDLVKRLLEARIVDPEIIARSMAKFLSLPYVSPESLQVHASAQQWLTALEGAESEVVPLRVENGVLYAAVADPFDLEVTERLQLLARKIRLSVASSDSIKKVFTQSLTSAVRFRTTAESSTAVVEERESSAVTEASEDAPAVKIINQLITAAVDENASDIHVEFQRSTTSIRFRIDGILRQVAAPETRLHDSLILRLKVMAELDIAERRIPQDGRFSFSLNGRKVDCRLSILPGPELENAVIRILDRNFHAEKSLNLEHLGFDDAFVASIRRAVNDPYGMVVVTGPTGSGKTTTLYAALSELDSTREKIVSIEDPIEYRVDGVTQVAVNEKKQLTFARGLRSILRHDPDKIMVGEIRDGETASIAVQSALTGHLVLTTIHANSSLEVVSRFTHLGVDLYELATGLNYVAAQRLLRLLCVHCKAPVRPDEEEMATIGSPNDEHHVWFEGMGCVHCQNTGYRGRIAIGEVLKVSPELRRMIVERRLPEDLASVAARNGFSSMREKAVALAMQGRTSLKEINRVTLVG